LEVKSRSAVKVRQATIEDIGSLIALGREMHDESPLFSQLDYDESKLAVLGEKLLEQGGVFLAEDEDLVVVGMFVGMVSEYFFGHDLMASDFALYVDEDHRGGSIGVRLVKAFEKWAFEFGAKVILLGISTGIQADRTAQLYNRLGFKTHGYTTLKMRTE